MSLPSLITGVAAQPFRGAQIGLAISQNTPMQGDPRTVVVSVPWQQYGAAVNTEIAININVRQGSPTQALDKIRSVYIDNTYSDISVYVLFIDTGFVVWAPPNSSVMAPVWSNTDDKVIVYADGFGVISIPTTTFHFSNVCHAGFIIQAGGGSVTPPATGLTIGRILLVGGGGGGGSAGASGHAGGGGGGGFLDSATAFTLAPGAYPVVIGGGGAPDFNGGPSSFHIYSVAGGGRGAGVTNPPGNGGCGGGGRGGTAVSAATSGGSGSAGASGGAGGAGVSGLPPSGGGGGGGASLVGDNGAVWNGTVSRGGGGGYGVASTISGVNTGYAGGGGGGGRGPGAGGTSGGSGGGIGGTFNSGVVTPTAANFYGGGGGGAADGSGASGFGGIVIIRYAGTALATGGVISTVGGDTVHTFTSTGMFTVL